MREVLSGDTEPLCFQALDRRVRHPSNAISREFEDSIRVRLQPLWYLGVCLRLASRRPQFPRMGQHISKLCRPSLMALIGKILGRLTVGSLGVRKEHGDVRVEAIEFPNVHIKGMDPIGYRALLLSLVD